MDLDPVDILIDGLARLSGSATQTWEQLAKAANLTPEQTEELKVRLAEAGAEPAPVAASGAVGRMARGAGKPTPSPEAGAQRPRNALTAAYPNSAGIQVGEPITDEMQLAEIFANQLKGMPRDGHPKGRILLASARAEYPEERRLSMDPHENTRKIEAVVGPSAPRYDRNGALVATGGICSPVNVDYAVPTWLTAERPIKDGLPAFEVPRGGIVFVKPPDIGEWEAATAIWTEATDASPAGETKPVLSLTCGSEEKVYVEAVPTRIGIGNMAGRFAAEQVAANTTVAYGAAARVAEENLLKLIEEASVKKLETAQELGMSRDLLAAVDYARAAHRSLHRIPASQMYTAIFPDWVKDLIRTDIAREQAHDNGGSFNVWEVSDAQIDSIFAQRKVNVIWHLDGQKEPTSKNYKTQYWGTPAESKLLDELLPKVGGSAGERLPWYFFPDGALQFLDGGRLDLGVVRDSTLDATNDYEMFVETFESIANRSFTKGVWQILSSIKATGGSAATVTAIAP